jgi:hypothetical protein
MRTRRLVRPSWVLAAAAVWAWSASEAAPDPGTAAPAAPPRGATSARAKRLWQVEAGGLDRGPVFAGDRVLLFDPAVRAPFAVDLRTGERRWTAAADPDLAPREASSDDSSQSELPRFVRRAQPRFDKASADLALADDVLLVSLDRRLVAYGVKDGRRLWSRPEPCPLHTAKGAYFLSECYGEKGGMVVSAAAEGKKVLVPPGDKWDQEMVLAGKALIVWNQKQAQLQSHPLGKGGPAWKVKLGSEQSRGRGIRLGGPRRLVAAGEAVVALGMPIVAFDAATGRELWRRPGQEQAEAVIEGRELWLVEGDRLLALEIGSGKVLHDELLPAAVAKLRDRALAAAGGRILFVGSPGRVDPDAVMVTWTRQTPKPTVLRRPAATTDVAIAGALLLAAGRFDGQLAALDPGALEPPLVALEAAAAVAAVIDELGSVERLLDSALGELPHLGRHFAEIARQPEQRLYESALLYLGRIPAPEALPALLARLRQARDDEERGLILAALAKQDDRRATDALLLAAKDEPNAKGTARAWQALPARHSLHEQLWRTGRTTEVGLCPPALTRPLPPTAPGGDKIGTAHPLVFQDVAADGSWVHVCQARADTTGDGKIEVRYGRHGDTYGDQIRPYLIIGTGSGHAFDEVLASDPTGRHLAVREGPCLSLVDTRARTITTVPNADLREADPVFGPARAVSFDGAGKQMVYLRGSVPRNLLILRDLTSGEERTLDPGLGNLWRAELDDGGEWLTLETVEGPEWPTSATSLAARICRGPPASYSVQGSRGMDLVVKRVLPSSGGTPQHVPSLVRPFGSNLLVRDPAGALVEIDKAGAQVRTLVPASCQASVLHADGARGLVLVGCHAKAPATLQLFGRQAKPLLPSAPIPDLDLPGHDVRLPGQRRFLQMAEHLYVDLDRQALVRAPGLGPDEVMQTTDWREREHGIYARRGDGTELRGPSASSRQNGPPSGPLRWQPPIAK